MAFTRQQIDYAKARLGRLVYSSRVAAALRQKFGLSLDRAYKLIEVAQQEAVAALRGESGRDPLVLLSMFLESVIADGKVSMRERIAAAAVYAKTLGLNKIAEALGDGKVDEFLAGVLTRQKARQESKTGDNRDI